MNTQHMEQIVIDSCRKHGWVMDPNKDLRAITEELGEVCREVRRYEDGRERPDEIDADKAGIREHIAEEMGDMLFPMIKLLGFFDLTLEDAFQSHCEKMRKRYENEGEKHG